MILTIPKQFRNRFTEKTIYIIRWQTEPALLLMNKAEHSTLMERFNKVTNSTNEGLSRLIKAGVEAVVINGNEIEIPDYLGKWLKDDKRGYKQGDFGLIVY